MINLGEKIKKIRLEKGLTQAELAEGICTQASISNLESNASVPSLPILLSIGKRLNIDIAELSEYAIEQNNPAIAIFKQVQNLRSQFKLKEAHDLLKKEIHFEELKTNHEKKQYYYYLGITSLLGYNKISDATYNFNLGLQLEIEPHLEFLDILITNGIGLAYVMGSEDEKALTLCDLGISLQKNRHTNYELDRLYYEKAFNLVQLGELVGAKEYYYHAGSLSKISGNEILFKVIQKDMDTFDLGTIPY